MQLNVFRFQSSIHGRLTHGSTDCIEFLDICIRAREKCEPFTGEEDLPAKEKFDYAIATWR